MASLNKVMLIGNLGKDPEIRVTSGGTTMANFRIATKENFKNKSGEWEERTEWHNIVLWGRHAENARDYLKSGRQVFIEGHLQTRKWQDRDGRDRWTTEIIGDRMQMLGPKGEGGGRSSRPEDSFPGAPTDDDTSFNPDDDIPF